MKKAYIRAEIEIVNLHGIDVITTSCTNYGEGGGTFSIGDSDENN